MLCALLVAWGANTAHADTSGAQLSIAASGQIIARGAEVVSVSGNTVVVSTEWAGVRVLWTVQVTGSTKVSPDIGSASIVKRIQPGHTVGFSGMLSGEGGRSVVLASALRDETLMKSSVSVVGTVESVDAKTGTFVIKTEDGSTTVVAGQGTLMSRNGNNARIGSISVGDSSKATGTLDTSTGTLIADRVFLRTGDAPAVASVPKPSVFASIVQWIQGSRGILSVRDR